MQNRIRDSHCKSRAFDGLPRRAPSGRNTDLKAPEERPVLVRAVLAEISLDANRLRPCAMIDTSKRPVRRTEALAVCRFYRDIISYIDGNGLFRCHGLAGLKRGDTQFGDVACMRKLLRSPRRQTSAEA